MREMSRGGVFRALRNVAFGAHVLLLIALLAVTGVLAPFVIFLHDDPDGGAVLGALTFAWVAMPFVTLAALLSALVLRAGGYGAAARRVTFVPYGWLLLELVLGAAHFAA